MSLTSLIGRKINQTQGFLEDGTRVPLSVISVSKNLVVQIKTDEHEGYSAVKLGFGIKNKPNKAEAGIAKKAGQEKSPRFFREVASDKVDIEVGAQIAPNEVFEPGDIVDVTGTSKGKGYAGVVKKHHFKGGPKTHGQSDRHRAPGSSGQGTTPGRVYKGKRMSGRMGNEQVTIKNLEVLSVDDGIIHIRGLVPGIKGGILVVKKVGKNKKFTPLYQAKTEKNIEVVKEVQEATEPEEVKTNDETVETVAMQEGEEVKTAEDTVLKAKENVKEEVVEEGSKNEEEIKEDENASK